MADLNLEELKRLVAEATPGPWRLDPTDPVTGYADVDDLIVGNGRHIASLYGPLELQPTRTYLPPLSECRANAPLIVAAVNSLPALIEEVERLRADKENAEEWAELIDPMCEVCSNFFVSHKMDDILCSKGCAAEYAATIEDSVHD